MSEGVHRSEISFSFPIEINYNFNSTVGPIRIKKIAKGSAADESGQLQVGDILLEVAKKSFALEFSRK